MALNELKMDAFSFSRRAVFKNVSKRQNPIFLRFSSAKTMNFFEISQNLKNRTCHTHVFFTILGIFFIRKKYGGKNFFMAEIGFYKEKWPFPPYFWKFSKVIKYTCFRNFRKIAILRGSKLSLYSLFFKSVKRFEEISTSILRIFLET